MADQSQLAAHILLAIILAGSFIVVLFVFSRWSKTFRKSQFEIEAETAPAPRRKRETWAVRLEGTNSAHIIGAAAESGRIVLGGWDTQSWRWVVGDYLMIYKGQFSTRYEIEKLFQHAASGWFTVECRFAPRTA